MPKNISLHPRKEIARLTDIPNVGKVIAQKLRQLHIDKPLDLIGKDPYSLYDELCHITGHKIDPCLLDVFISAVHFMEGGAPKKWWEFTAERKKKLLIIVPSSLRNQWCQELSDKFYLPSIILEAKSFNQLIKQGDKNPFDQDKIVICSYHFARNKEKSYPIQIPW